MLIKSYSIRSFMMLVSSLFLCQCTPAVNSSISETPTFQPAPVVVKKKQKSPYTMPTATYLSQAKKQEGNEKQQSLLLAAGRLISEGQWRQSATILAQTTDLTPVLADEKSILSAQIELMRDRPQIALDKLAQIKTKEQLSPYLQIQFHELLAQANNAQKKPLESIKERIRLEPLLLDEGSQKSNHRKLWLSLTSLSPTELESSLAQSEGQIELQGWLQLALISHQYRDNSPALISALEQWKTRFNTHPANHILPDPLDSIANKMAPQPKQIALLLPLSGAVQGPGGAVKDGFMAALKERHDAVMKVKTYDTNKADAATLYQNAIAEGADYVVGPLIKAQVAAIAALPHPVPTLLLNDSDTQLEGNSYLFGLSPLNEAVQVAVKARSKGYHRALVIAPENAWGHEVSNAFSRQWEKKGGRIVDTMRYGANEDLNKKMKDFLHVTQSLQREKQVKELLGYSIQSMTNRRQDFDMIFLLAYPTKARQIMPLLNYYYAANVPVFATASVYSGSANALKDKDLDGLVFCDIPWVFSHQMGARNWPEQFNSYNRLYALGKESYSLVTNQLNSLVVFPAGTSGKGDGIFYLKPSQQVARVLEWGQFKQGLAHSLGETT